MNLVALAGSYWMIAMFKKYLTILILCSLAQVSAAASIRIDIEETSASDFTIRGFLDLDTDTLALTAFEVSVGSGAGDYVGEAITMPEQTISSALEARFFYSNFNYYFVEERDPSRPTFTLPDGRTQTPVNRRQFRFGGFSRDVARSFVDAHDQKQSYDVLGNLLDCYNCSPTRNGTVALSYTYAAPPLSGEVPLPASLPLLAVAMGGLWGWKRRRSAG